MINLHIVRSVAGDDNDGKREAVTIDSRDVLIFERTTKGGSFATLTKDVRFEHLYIASWIAAKRLKLVAPDVSLTAFQDCYILDLTAEDDEPDPTQSAA